MICGAGGGFACGGWADIAVPRDGHTPGWVGGWFGRGGSRGVGDRADRVNAGTPNWAGPIQGFPRGKPAQYHVQNTGIVVTLPVHV